MTKQQAMFVAWRFYLMLVIISLTTVSLAVRVFDLSVLNRPFLNRQGDERFLRLMSTPAFRGMILDRYGAPLAVSTTVAAIWVNPQEFHPASSTLTTLSHLLNMPSATLMSMTKVAQHHKREFLYLKRGVSPQLATQIKHLNIPGLYTQASYHRFYPEGEVTAHLIGFTNVDDQGQEGLELAFNRWLQGEPGKKWVIKDRLGRAIADVQTERTQQAGKDLVLSIDKRLQYLAYRELQAGLLEHQAHAGSAIILDVKTGEVLALVNLPSYNPNQRAHIAPDHIRNRALTDIFEPGSTIKAFTIASALESKQYLPDSIVDTSPGWFRLDRNIVKDEKNNGRLSLAQILQRSSNVGAAKVVLDLPANQLWDLLHRVGFGEATGIGFPGEQAGKLVKREPWGAFMLATLSFGYGMSVSALQLARAYAVLANDGIKTPISLLKLDHAPSGERVVDAKVCREMLTLLETVVAKGGTGELARVPGYRVAGKTGTAKMVGKEGYEQHRYTASFVGIAPVSDPRLVVAVVIHDPQGKAYVGAKVSAPVFARIMEASLRMLALSPDAA